MKRKALTVTKLSYLFSFLSAALLPIFLFSSPSEAALGDFRFKWGSYGSALYTTEYPYGFHGIAVDANGNIYVSDYGVSKIQVYTKDGIFLRSIGSRGSADGQFSGIFEIAIDGSGNVYILDKGNSRVEVFSSTGTFLRKWGSAGSDDGQFNYPGGIAVDANGNVYVADTNNYRIQVFTNAGIFLRKWGTEFSPSGIAVDKNGNVYTTDGRVQVFTNTGTLLRTWGDYCNIYTGNGTCDGGFNLAYGIAVDINENVYVVDHYNDRVQVFTSAGMFLRKWGTRGSEDGQFLLPTGIALDSNGNVYVVDSVRGNNPNQYSTPRVQVFSGTGVFQEELHLFEALFSYPYGIAVDDNGNVIIADTGNNRVLVSSNTGTYLRKWQWSPYTSLYGVGTDEGNDVYVTQAYVWSKIMAFNGNTGASLGEFGTCFFSQDCSATGMLRGPNAVAVDSSGNVFVSDAGNNRVQVFTKNGTFLWAWGSVGTGNGQFNYPTGIAVDRSGNVYVSDSGNNRIQVFNSTGDFLRTWGTYGIGAGQFNSPNGIAIDKNGTVYVLDTGLNRIQVFTDTGIFLGQWGGYGTGDGQFNYPRGIAVDGNANVYVSDSGNHRIQVFEGYRSCNLTVDAGPDQTVIMTSSIGASVTLSGSASALGCAGDLSYEWSWPGGSATGQSPVVLMSRGTTLTTLTVRSGSFTVTDTVAISVVYNFSGFLEPVSLDKPFRIGSTIPVKFQLTDAAGMYISSANVIIRIQKYSDSIPVEDPINAEATGGADTGNTFRYDATAYQYIYNLSTRSLSESTWQIQAILDDGTVKTAFVSMKVN